MRILIGLGLISVLTAISHAQQAPTEGEDIPPVITYHAAKTGVFWYGMYGNEGETQGYVRLTITETSTKGRHFDWDLHVAWDGGNYEENRQLTLDTRGEMTYAENSTGDHRCLAARAGNVMVGKNGADDLRVEVRTGAISSLPFFLAAALPQQAGTKLTRRMYDDRDGFKDAGDITITVEGSETVELPEGKVEAWKVVCEQPDGRRIAWVNKDREIVQVTTGGKAAIRLHRQETTHLYQPKAPLFDIVNPADKTQIQLTGVFANFTLEEMWNVWTTPEGLKTFWAPSAEIEGKVGGKYWLLYPNEEKPGEYHYRMLGKITHWEPHRKFGTTWHWDFESDEQTLNLVMDFEAVKGGVRVNITHGKFDDSKEAQKNRDSILEGWEYFGNQLKRLKDKPRTAEPPEEPPKTE